MENEIDAVMDVADEYPSGIDGVDELMRWRAAVRAAVERASIDALQARVHEWHERNFPDATEPQRALIICEEAGELAHVVLKQSQGIRPETATDDMLKDAMGDIVIATLAFVAHRGWSMQEILDTTAATVLARNWTLERQRGGEG